MTDAIIITARRQIIRLGLGLAAINLLLPLGLLVWARITGESWWRMFQGEENAVTWFSSVQLLAIGAVAWCNHRVGGLVEPTRRGPRAWIWIVFALGFVGLSIDERFELHEQLRDRILAPRDIASELGFVEPSDLGLYLVLVVGLVATGFLVGELRRRPLAFALFAAAVVLAGTVVVIDSVRGEIAYEWELGWFWNYVFEETGELWAQLLFLLSFLIVLLDRLAVLDREGGGARLLEAVRRGVPWFAGLLVAVNIALPLGYLLRSAFTGESFYEAFWGERDAVSWFSSVQLLIVGLSAYAVHEITVLRRERLTATTRPWIWLLCAAGFAFLALDERFEWHEALRDDVAEPLGLFVVPGLRDHDVGLFVYMAFGLVFAWFLFAELRANRRARNLFLAAVVMSALIVVEDGLARDVRGALPLPGFWDSAFEEIGEIWTQLCFCMSFLVIFRERAGGPEQN